MPRRVPCGGPSSRVLPLWRNPVRPTFAKPWREVLFVLLGVVGTLLLGQLWSRGIRLDTENSFTESINQIIIFAPILLVPILRRDGWASAWIRWDRIWLRVFIGLVIAWIVLFMFTRLEAGAESFGTAVHTTYVPWKAHVAVQVLLEDIAIAILFVRLAAAIGPRKTIIAVALLFAAAHIPAMISQGASAAELAGLLRDFGLGLIVLGTAWRSADIMWLWPIHFTLDMTQFLGN